MPLHREEKEVVTYVPVHGVTERASTSSTVRLVRQTDHLMIYKTIRYAPGTEFLVWKWGRPMMQIAPQIA